MYYKDLESDKNQMAAHNAAMKANARARLDAYAKYRWLQDADMKANARARLDAYAKYNKQNKKSVK